MALDTKEKEKPATEKAPFEDDDLVTVLYGYGRVAPNAVSWLDDYRVEGGVVRNVPYSIAKHWQKGTRPDGKKPNGRVKVSILPNDAPEVDFERAAGITEEDKQRMATYMSATDADALISKLPKDKLQSLRIAIDRHLNRTSPL